MHREVTHGKFTWHSFDSNDEAALIYLKEHFDFHELDYEDVAGGPQQPKADFYEKYLFSVLHFPDYHEEDRRIHVTELDVFLGHDYVVTVCKGTCKELAELFDRLTEDEQERKGFMGEGSAFFFYEIVDMLAKAMWPVVRTMSDQIGDIEEDIYSEDMRRRTVWNIALVKRNLIRLKRITEPDHLAVAALVGTDKPYFTKKLSIYFDDVNDTLNRIRSITESHVEVMNSLHHVSESLISQRTNEVIKLLTIFSVSLLPLTLLSGIYGMNIELPFAGHPRVIWIMFVAIFSLISLVIIYFRKRGWL
ncbi:MAG: magnesium transporter CorA family protein [Parcubacteria group bacterium]|nr:magnesium transporter CorA family protein [Parcubacteria group bacterium]